MLDLRINACRPDLADIRCSSDYEAKRYVTGQPAQIFSPIVTVHKTPGAQSPVLTQALLGENILIFENKDGWLWIQLETDGYVGYVMEACVTTAVTVPTHKIYGMLAHIYPQPDIKTMPLDVLPFQAQVTVVSTSVDGKWCELSRGGYVKVNTLTTLLTVEKNLVDVALRFLHAPYLWGGKTALGIDCSGLVQLGLQALGQECPRDSDMQKVSLGNLLNDNASLQRGDLIFFDGHVGIMHDDKSLLHANATTMTVTIEDLTIVADRTPVTARKRLA